MFAHPAPRLCILLPGARLAVCVAPLAAAGVQGAHASPTSQATLKGYAAGGVHGDDPTGIAFANPSNPPLHKLRLPDDDITACANLYGPRAVSTRPDQRLAAPAPPPFPLQASLVEGSTRVACPTTPPRTVEARSGSPDPFAASTDFMPTGATGRLLSNPIFNRPRGPLAVVVPCEAASVDGTLHARTAAGWSTRAVPRFKAQSPARVALGLARHLDLRPLPAGAARYGRHAPTLDEVMRQLPYRLVSRL
jgi:hypothetical protein